MPVRWEGLDIWKIYLEQVVITNGVLATWTRYDMEWRRFGRTNESLLFRYINYM